MVAGKWQGKERRFLLPVFLSASREEDLLKNERKNKEFSACDATVLHRGWVAADERGRSGTSGNG
jgi:hypothetical protein